MNKLKGYCLGFALIMTTIVAADDPQKGDLNQPTTKLAVEMRAENNTTSFMSAILKLSLTSLTTACLTVLGTMQEHHKFGRLSQESSLHELAAVIAATGVASALTDLGVEKARPLVYQIPLAAFACKLVNADLFQQWSRDISPSLGCTNNQVLAEPGSIWRISPGRFGLTRSIQAVALYTLLKEIVERALFQSEDAR